MENLAQVSRHRPAGVFLGCLVFKYVNDKYVLTIYVRYVNLEVM